MKLKRKFSLIVLFTVIQVLFLTGFALFGFRRVQRIKDYQEMQYKTQSDLSSVILYLDELDNWGFKTTNAYRDWTEKKEELQADFNFLLNNPITKSFSEDFNNNLVETKTIWQVVLTRFESIEPILQDIENVKLPLSTYTYTQKDGIRYAYTKLPDDEKVNQLMEYLEKCHDPIKGIRNSFDSLQRVNKKASMAIADILEFQYKIYYLTTIIVAVFSTLILVLVISMMTRNITRRIITIQKKTSVLANKDFSSKMEPSGKDEMRTLMVNINEMVEQINNFFLVVKTCASEAIISGATINESADTTAVASEKISENLNNISTKFDLINESVAKAIKAIEEMNIQIDTLVDNNARQTAAIADSNNSVNEVVETLDYINKMAEERARNAEEMNALVVDGDQKISLTSDLLEKITEDLDEIKEVIDIINNVAEQTNLLSMNAAIESAHAGEAGKGFAVVAEEIRSLAENTTENAARIGNVIKSVVSAVENANASSTEAQAAFEKVSVHAENVVGSLKEISGGIGKIDNQMSQIKTKSQETALAADQINSYCGELVQKQSSVSIEVGMMTNEIQEAVGTIHQIKAGTEDIVSKMQSVSNASKISYEDMEQLSSILEEFKTSSGEEETEYEEEYQEEMADNSSEEVQAVPAAEEDDDVDELFSE